MNIALVKLNLLRLTNSPDSVLGMDSMASERFRRSPSLQFLSYSGDKDRDEGLGNATEEDYLSPDLDENEIIRCGINKEAKDEIDQLTCKFRSLLMKTLNGESGDLDYTASSVDKDLNLKITVIEVHCSYISSNNYCHRQFTRGGKSLVLDLTISALESGKTDASKEIGTSQNDLGRSNLPLPPRLREASYRNPLHLRSPRKYSFKLQTLSSFKELFSPQESSRRNSVRSALSELKKKQNISVKLWRSSQDLRKYGKKPEVLPHFPGPQCWRPAPHEERRCRWEWMQALEFKVRSKWGKFMQSHGTFCASRRRLTMG